MKPKREVVRYPVRIPQNIDLEQLLLSHPLPNIPNAKDYLLYVLSLIDSDGTLTFLNSTSLQKKVDNYKPLLEWLINRDILETDDTYILNAKSKGYNFKIKYVTNLKEEYILKRTLIRKLSPIDIKQSTPDNIGEYGYMAHWLTNDQVAEQFNLKPRVMTKGLRFFGLIDDPNEENTIIEEHNAFGSEIRLYQYEDSFRDFIYKRIVKINKRTLFISDKLFINDAFVAKIKECAVNNPSHFPRKKIQIS